MTTALRLFLVFAIAVYFLILISLLKKNKLALRYALAWLMIGGFMLLFAIFPDVVYKTSAWVGISNPVNAVFLLFAGFVILLLLLLTAIVSDLSEKSLRTAQTLALLEKRVRELENNQNKK